MKGRENMESIKSLVDSLPVLLHDIKDYNTQLVAAYKRRLNKKGTLKK